MMQLVGGDLYNRAKELLLEAHVKFTEHPVPGNYCSTSVIIVVGESQVAKIITGIGQPRHYIDRKFFDL